MTDNLKHERLMQVLSFDESTGCFHWKVRNSSRSEIGSVAGHKTSLGYWRINLDGRQYQAHRLAWFYVHGTWPVDEIDHANRVKTDNRISNLRSIGRSGNQQNKGIYRNNTSGATGVSWHRKHEVWRTYITVKNKKILLGSFKCFEQAKSCYELAKLAMHV